MEDNNITQKDFELFLQNKKIDTSNNENNKKMFDSFLVFQKFMNAMLSTTTLNKNNEQNDNEENKNIKEEKKEEGQKKEEIKKKEVKKNAKTDVGSFEILNNEDYENVQNQNKETDSDKDDW